MAGCIASRTGSARAAPAPRSSVRREIIQGRLIMSVALCAARRERRRAHDADGELLQPVPTGGELTLDLGDATAAVLDGGTAAERIDEHLLGHTLGHPRVALERGRQPGGADPGAAV